MWVNSYKYNCWITRRDYVYFYRKVPHHLKKWCTGLHSHQQCMRAPVASHSCRHLVLSVCWVWAILMDVWWWLMVLICSSLTTYDSILYMLSYHLYIMVFDRSICPFYCFYFLFLSFKSSLYILDLSPLFDMHLSNLSSYTLAWIFILL